MATETAATGRESDKFMLRFPEGMRATIKEAAEKNGRTMNAEIVARLQSSFAPGGHGQAVIRLSAHGEGGADAGAASLARTVDESLKKMQAATAEFEAARSALAATREDLEATVKKFSGMPLNEILAKISPAKPTK